MSEADIIRSQLGQLLGFQLQEDMAFWELLGKNGHISKMVTGKLTPAQLMDQIHALHKDLVVPDMANVTEKMVSLDDIFQIGDQEGFRQAVQSYLVANEVSKHEAVRTFRQSVLDNKLLLWSEVEWWILVQAMEERQQATAWLNGIPVPPEYMARALQQEREDTLSEEPVVYLRVSYKQIAQYAQSRYLKYALPNETFGYQIHTTAGGVLEQLRQLSKYLADGCTWTVAQATIFVLTGLSPVLSSIRSEIQFREILAASRIILSIDPGLTAEEVAEHYRRVRRDTRNSRQREMSKKHLMLALFSATRPETETYAEQMAIWNKGYPQWQYKELTNFGRDCKLAQQRLLLPDLHLPGGLLPRRVNRPTNQAEEGGKK